MAERTGFGRGRLFALIEGNKSEASNPFADGNRSKPDEEEKPKAHGAGRGSLILAAAAAVCTTNFILKTIAHLIYSRNEIE